MWSKFKRCLFCVIAAVFIVLNISCSYETAYATAATLAGGAAAAWDFVIIVLGISSGKDLVDIITRNNNEKPTAIRNLDGTYTIKTGMVQPGTTYPLEITITAEEYNKKYAANTPMIRDDYMKLVAGCMTPEQWQTLQVRTAAASQGAPYGPLSWNTYKSAYDSLCNKNAYGDGTTALNKLSDEVIQALRYHNLPANVKEHIGSMPKYLFTYVPGSYMVHLYLFENGSVTATNAGMSCSDTDYVARYEFNCVTKAWSEPAFPVGNNMFNDYINAGIKEYPVYSNAYNYAGAVDANFTGVTEFPYPLSSADVSTVFKKDIFKFQTWTQEMKDSFTKNKNNYIFSFMDNFGGGVATPFVIFPTAPVSVNMAYGSFRKYAIYTTLSDAYYYKDSTWSSFTKNYSGYRYEYVLPEAGTQYENSLIAYSNIDVVLNSKISVFDQDVVTFPYPLDGTIVDETPHPVKKVTYRDIENVGTVTLPGNITDVDKLIDAVEDAAEQDRQDAITDAYIKPGSKTHDLVQSLVGEQTVVDSGTVNPPADIDKPTGSLIQDLINTTLSIINLLKGLFTTLWDWLRRIWESIVAIPNSITSFFTINMSVVSAELAPFQAAWEAKFSGITGMAAKFKNLSVSDTITYPDLSFPIPGTFSPSGKVTEVKISLKQFSKELSTLRTILSALLWVGFAWNVIGAVKVQFNID